MCWCRRKSADSDVADTVSAVPPVGDSRDAAPADDAVVVAPRRRVLVARSSLIIAAVVLVLDQITKHWALNALADGEARPVFWTLQWNLAFNRGMAFSKGAGWGPVIGIVAFAVVVVLARLTSRLGTRTARCAAGLLIGGALGNITDRLFRGDAWLRGAVVDFIDVQWWPIFNIADMAVTVGAVLFAIEAFRTPTSAAPAGNQAA